MKESGDILQVQGINSKGFGTIPKLVMQDRKLTIQAKAIYGYFCSYAGAGRTAFPSIGKIVDDLKISKNTYYKHFKYLKDYGYIKVHQEKSKEGYFSKSIFTLNENIECTSINDTNNKSNSPCTKSWDTKNRDTNICDTKINSYKNKQYIKNNSLSVSEDGQGQTDADQLRLIIHRNIDYTSFCNAYPNDTLMADEIVSIMLDVLVSESKAIRIDQEDKPREIVKSMLLKINYFDLIDVISRFKAVVERVKRKRQYILSMLYNVKLESQSDLINRLDPQYR